jgi:hypothetical protein
MSVLSNFASGFRRFLSPSCAVPRLRILYCATLALCGALLFMLHISLAGEQRLAHALSVETRAAVAAPRVIFLPVPPIALKAKANIHRPPAAPQRKGK